MTERSTMATSAEQLRRRGFITTGVRSVLGREGEQRFATEAAGVLDRLTTVDIRAAPVVPGPARSAVFDLGLHPLVIDVFGRAMGTRHSLVAVHVRHDDSRQLPRHLGSWHVDAEDRRMIRMIVYLVDVGRDDAAFEAVPHTPRLAGIRDRSEGDDTSNPVYRPLDDAELSALVSRHEWSAVAGPALTVVAAATGLVLHRVRPGTGGRWALTFTYLPRSTVPVRSEAGPDWLTPSEREVYGLEAVDSSPVLVQP